MQELGRDPDAVREGARRILSRQRVYIYLILVPLLCWVLVAVLSGRAIGAHAPEIATVVVPVAIAILLCGIAPHWSLWVSRCPACEERFFPARFRGAWLDLCWPKTCWNCNRSLQQMLVDGE